jgi:ribosomal protein S18 acetylase RimI-like enzyme
MLRFLFIILLSLNAVQVHANPKSINEYGFLRVADRTYFFSEIKDLVSDLTTLSCLKDQSKLWQVMEISPIELGQLINLSKPESVDLNTANNMAMALEKIVIIYKLKHFLNLGQRIDIASTVNNLWSKNNCLSTQKINLWVEKIEQHLRIKFGEKSSSNSVNNTLDLGALKDFISSVNNFIIHSGELPLEQLNLFQDWDNKYFPYPWALNAWPIDFKNYIFYFYYLNADLSAIACFKTIDHTEPAHLLKIIVTPVQRRKSVGQTFLLMCLSDLKVRGINNCYLEVSAQNPVAIHLYNKCGFHQFNQISHFYGDGSSAITMGNYQ